MSANDNTAAFDDGVTGGGDDDDDGGIGDITNPRAAGRRAAREIEQERSDSSDSADSEDDTGSGTDNDTDTGDGDGPDPVDDDPRTGGTATPDDPQGGDRIDPETGEISGGDTGPEATDRPDDSGKDTADGSDSVDGTTNPRAAGRRAAREIEQERRAAAADDGVPEYDGTRYYHMGEAARGNETGVARAEILEEGGQDGRRVVDEGDDPFAPDPGTTGLETNPNSAGARTANEVRKLKREVGEQIPGVDADETRKYNIRRQGGQLDVVLTDAGLAAVAERTEAQAATASEEFDRGDLEGEVVGGDVTVEATDRALRERALEQAAEQTPGAEPGDFRVVVQDGQVRAVMTDRELRERALNQAVEQVPGSDRDDFRVTVEDGEARAALTDEGLREVAAAGTPGADQDDLLVVREDGERTVRLADRSAAISVTREPASETAPGTTTDGDLTARRTSRPSAAVGAPIREATGFPTERELAQNLRNITGLPNQRELRAGANEALADVTGVDVRQSFEQSRKQARRETLSTAAASAKLAQENPGKALAVGTPIALAEPTPAGEAGLLGGLVAGVIGIDLAARIRAQQTERPVISPSELPAPEEPQNQPAELPAPDERPRERTELDAPRRRPESFIAEIDVPNQPVTTERELSVPDETDTPPTAIRTAQLIGRQRARQEQVERERPRRRGNRAIPERFIPDEEQTIGREEVEEPSVDESPQRQREFVGDRPEGGVRTFGEEATEPAVERPGDSFVEVGAGTVAGAGSGAGVLSGPGVRDRQRTGARGRIDTRSLLDAAQQPLQLQRLGLQQRLRRRQAQRNDVAERSRVVEQQRTQTRTRYRTPYPTEQFTVEETVGVGFGPGIGIGIGTRFRRPQAIDRDRARETTPGPDIGGGEEDPEDLVPGYAEETFAAFGGVGAEGRQAPDQDVLEAQPFAAQAAGSLPVAAILDEGDDREAFESAAAFFSFGGVDD